MFEQLWKQVEQFTTLSNYTQVITDTDIVINNMQIILPNTKASLHPIHLISQTKGVNITISNCSIEGVRFLLDNTNMSLYIEKSTFAAAGINIQSDDNTECLPVHIWSCNFSGHFPEDTLIFNNTDNISIESCHFTDLQFSTDESSIIKGINSSFHIDNSVFTKNTGSISIHGGSSQIINCSFTKSRSCLKAKDTTVNISMSQFDGNRDGCIHRNNALLHIVDSNLTSNIAKQNGAAVNVNLGQVSLYHCSLINNTVRLWYNHVNDRWEGESGAVYAENCRVTIDNCSLINNTAWWYEGAVSARDSHVTLGNCSLINNTAKYGGAVYTYNSKMTLGNCSLINNTAMDDGGAMSAHNSQMTLGNCSLINNTARYGGAVSAWDNSHVTLGNCSLINNTARYGGAVHAWDNSHVTLGNCSLINNTARDNGGAVYAWCDCHVTLGNCSLINNTARYGGAVHAWDNSDVTLGNCSLINNTARDNGGAVYAWCDSHVTLGNCSLIKSTAMSGGAVYTWWYSHVTLDNCSLINNTAKGTGGAVYIGNAKSLLKITDSHFISNRAGHDGGGIHVFNGQMTMKRCSLINNEAKQDSGAIDIYSKSEEIATENTLIDNNFTGNTAINGGALRVTRRKVTLKGCHMIDNSAKQDGGSIFITDKSKLVIEDSFVIQNSCRKNGGAIMVHLSSNMSLASVQFVNNTAGSGGGAVMILDHSELFDTGSIFMQNLARGFGEYGSIFVTLH